MRVLGRVNVNLPSTVICSKSTIETLQKVGSSNLKIKTQSYWCRSGLFIVNFEHISNDF